MASIKCDAREGGGAGVMSELRRRPALLQPDVPGFGDVRGHSGPGLATVAAMAVLFDIEADTSDSIAGRSIEALCVMVLACIWWHSGAPKQGIFSCKRESRRTLAGDA
jgi:hypothetical protein